MTQTRDTVLVVDDSPETLGFLTEAMEAEGVIVLVATSGRQALAIAGRITPDVVLMDAMMPEMDGFEACRQLKTMPALAHVPVIFMTGLTETEHIVRGLASGGVDYLAKPIDLDELRARIRVHLANARANLSAQTALDAAGRHLVALDTDGRIVWATPQAGRLIDDLGIEMQGRLTRVAMMDRVHVRADKSEAMQHSEVVWRVERQGRPRWAVVLEQDADTEAMPKIEAVFGCSVGEVVKVPARRLRVAEMVAARPMLRGEHFLAEYRISYGHTVTPSFRTQRAVADTVRTLGLSVSFDPGTVPARVSSGFQASMGQPPEHPTPIVVTGAQTQAVWVEARPGVYSLMWEWD